ncbi:response regulator [Paracoccus sp. (in: a-proteobacteria)]|uniref:response regulator n=1 Tax=Paracoccus sp. TaxID=267 RepID=UPI00396C3EC6
MQKPDLAGRRILVVEDEFILAAHICAQIEACGGVVVGPAPTLASGEALLQKGPLPDGGILNIRIGDVMVYPLADDLLAAGVPIIFASSESKSCIPDRYASVPLLGKPIDMMLVAKQLFPAR